MTTSDNTKDEGPSIDNGHLTEEATALYCESLLASRTEVLPARMQQHVEECLACKRNIALLLEFLQSEKQIAAGIDEDDAYVAKKSIGRYRSTSFILTIAAIALVLVSVVIFLSIILKDPGRIRSNPAEVSSLHDKPPAPSANVTHGKNIVKEIREAPVIHPGNQLLAANFRPLPYLENMVSDNTRSQGIDAAKPGNDAVYKKEMTFSWKVNNEKIVFSIRNNRNQTIFSRATENSEFIFRQHLDPGLYYWTLENEKEILYVGKFTVRN